MPCLHCTDWLQWRTLSGLFFAGAVGRYGKVQLILLLTPKYLLPTQWVSSPSPTYSPPLRPVRVPVHTAPWHTNYAIYDASLRHRNLTEITGLMCEQKPYPVWFSRLRNSAQCEPADTFHRSIITQRSEDVSSIFLFTQIFFNARHSTTLILVFFLPGCLLRGASIPPRLRLRSLKIKFLFTRRLEYKKESFKVSRQGRTPFYDETLVLSGTQFICQYI